MEKYFVNKIFFVVQIAPFVIATLIQNIMFNYLLDCVFNRVLTN